MATIFLLGPSVGDSSKGVSHGDAPMKSRRKIAQTLRENGHNVILMEDEADGKGEDLVQKFDRLLHQDVTDIVVYWPPLAKMPTTYTELVLLYDRHQYLKEHAITIWVLHHVSVASIKKDEFKVLEPGGRNRYLDSIVRLGVHPLEWDSEEALQEQIDLLSAEL